jgi:hypothetical protein
MVVCLILTKRSYTADMRHMSCLLFTLKIIDLLDVRKASAENILCGSFHMFPLSMYSMLLAIYLHHYCAIGGCKFLLFTKLYLCV